jgi:2-methylisocitrate lyase-like PEP mutase family enzyme
MGPSAARTLRERLDRVPAEGPLLCPGAYDAFSARLVAEAGFEAVYLTGFGATASLLGQPDVGLLTGSEMADQAQRLSSAVDLPVLADADTGYGNAINVERTVADYERAGVGALQLEDQTSPKRCGHMSGKEVVPTAEMVTKLRAAAAARRDPDLVLIARTDAAAVEDLGSVLDRARAYRDAGADALFIEALTSEEDVERVAGALAGEVPLVFNWVEGGRTPPIDLPRIAELGFAAVLYPIGTLLAATAGMRAYLSQLGAEGTPTSALPDLPSFSDITEVLGLPELRAREQSYTAESTPDA